MADVLTSTATRSARAQILAQRLHHTARVVKNQETTRAFYEEIVGLPLVATWTEINEFPGVPGKISFCHTFFALADGGALAFFQFADPAVYEVFKANVQPGFNHLALAVSREAQDEIQARLEAAGHGVTVIDHGYVRSIYFTDPDQMNLELASDPANVEEIAEGQGRTAHTTLERWLGGDHTSNNDLQPS